MKTLTSKSSKLTKLLTTGTMTALAALALTSQTAQAEPTGYNQISFSVDASQEVQNDEVTATLYKKAQASSPKLLATELNKAMNQAMNTAKRYPKVIATTGSQNTYPRYDDNGKITGWTGTVSIDLKSNDFASASELVAQLQQNLVVQNIQFGISEEKQKQVKKELIKKASLEFKDQAKSLTETWDMSGYQVVNVSINSNGGYYPRPVMMMRDSAATKSSAPPAQSFEGGNSRLSVTANGTIELIPWMQ
ncbi:SIMPL domain-containing protein [Psychrobacter sp. FDAARGOS_221]|uniref:SIMPL domain-containing protein n=1 Tax=Psychrobacter sp. FDAARGOS_221 TaxID=1975705 RepID=UPI001D0CE702|nr:SIMPL domain-containing protein [Psychrobacter sp. FDAARGOS_221]